MWSQIYELPVVVVKTNDLLVSAGAPQPAECIQTLMQRLFSTLVQEIQASHSLSQSLWILWTIKPKPNLFNVILHALELTPLYKQLASIQAVLSTRSVACCSKIRKIRYPCVLQRAFTNPPPEIFYVQSCKDKLSDTLLSKRQIKSSFLHTFDLSSSCLFVQSLYISAFTNI